MSSQPLIDELQTSNYTTPDKDSVSETSSVHIDIDNEPHVMGIRPHPHRTDLNLPTIEAIENFKQHREISVGNIVWSVLFGSWLSLFFFATGLVLLLTVFFYREGLFFLRAGIYIVFPFGKYAYKKEKSSKPTCSAKIANVILSPIYGSASILAIGLSWELVYFIPMAKAIWAVLKLAFTEDVSNVYFGKLVRHNPQAGHNPLFMCLSSGSWFYFKFTVFSLEVVYLNFVPFVILALIVGFVNCEGTFLGDPILGTAFALLGAMPCAYLIGICVDDLSKQMGIILGSILNSLFLAIVELILYYFSLKVGLVNVTRAAITGAFLMNLLIIPGFAMLFAGFKWKEVVLNRKAQSVGGTFLLLALVSVMFPSIFYHIHSTNSVYCNECNITGEAGKQAFNCSSCESKDLTNLMTDPIYVKYAQPLMYAMSILMPIIFCTSVIFSVKTHAHIYKIDVEEEQGGMSKITAIILLAISTVGFSMMAHVMTEKIPEAIERLHFSERFVGLIFYTLIPNVAEYMNAIKFALNGNIGLSMEIGNQGAILTSLVEMPALVLISFILYKTHVTKDMFTLVFPLIDIFCVIVAVFLRNSILSEKTINYFTGLSFLLIFLLISVVYYFDTF